MKELLKKITVEHCKFVIFICIFIVLYGIYDELKYIRYRTGYTSTYELKNGIQEGLQPLINTLRQMKLY